MALSRVALLTIHGLALQAVGYTHPYLISAGLQTVAVLVNTLIRTYQLRAFHRWQQGRASKATSSGSGSVSGASTPDQVAASSGATLLAAEYASIGEAALRAKKQQ